MQPMLPKIRLFEFSQCQKISRTHWIPATSGEAHARNLPLGPRLRYFSPGTFFCQFEKMCQELSRCPPRRCKGSLLWSMEKAPIANWLLRHAADQYRPSTEGGFSGLKTRIRARIASANAEISAMQGRTTKRYQCINIFWINFLILCFECRNICPQKASFSCTILTSSDGMNSCGSDVLSKGFAKLETLVSVS